MKIIFNKVILAFVFITAITSCKKDYLNTTPTEGVATSVAFSTTTNAWAALNGIHRIMYSQTFGVQAQGGQSGNMLYMDILGDDVVFNTAASTWLLSEYKWISHRNPSSSMLYYNYQFYYVIIGNANMIIANIDAASGADADKAAIKGQALAYRAWAYFQMVQLFGERYVAGAANNSLAVPLVLVPGNTVTPRNTVAEVYTQINADIDQAINSLASYTRANKSHLNVNVAKGIKARIALTQQNWTVAAQFAKEARSGFTLMTNTQYLAGFNDYSNSEWLWASKIQSDQTSYFYSFFAYMSANYSSTVIRTSPKSIYSVLYNKITTTDVRKKLWDPTGKNTADFPIPTTASSRYAYMSRKFKVADASLSIGDVPYMRAAELYLIEAEALARSGDNTGAAAALYPLAVNRDPSYVLSVKTGAALIDEIMTQRRVELWGEGFRFYDLKRTNSALDRTGGNHSATFTSGELSIPATNIRWQFLIPQDEITISNGVVVQNAQ
ncbi:SusD family protein [Pedobacter westerhofensis]|uniref:SusD family protein n=1 Tax=Pedobacter westerhofensis TaxID=425512 RepID=A0A521F745_9SPHI|nr:RagB/SusD family nutrient uptake outer membrane protein [Pedobacter westerhofensis]SMO92019.1 SusD family protein [Pedobacter westerhofensis]